MHVSVALAYSQLVPNRDGCGRKDIQRKNTLDCMAGLTCSCLCGCCRPASGHTVRGMSETGPAINQIQN